MRNDWNRACGGFVQWILILALAAIGGKSDAASFGVNWQSDHAGYGPYPVGGETPATAFGVPASQWFQPGLDPVADTMAHTGSRQVTVVGGNVTLTWDSSKWDENLVGLNPRTAYGWARANQTDEFGTAIPSPPGDPPTGDWAVLSKFLFATGAGEYGPNAHPIQVSLTGLGTIADLSQGFTVRLIASSEWNVKFTPAQVSDNSGNNQIVHFTNLPETPGWWTGDPWFSSGATGSSTTAAFTGDTLNILLDGWNEYSNPDDNFNPWRTTLSGIIIDYVPLANEGQPGDFNGDTLVDAADYLVWRNHLEGDESVLNGNGDQSGTVDVGDYELWKLHYGDGTLAAILPGAQVPEPATLLLLAMGAAVGLCRGARLDRGTAGRTNL